MGKKQLFKSKSVKFLTILFIFMSSQLFSQITNIALNKPTSQTSTAYGAESSRAVDGNTDGDFDNGSVTHTIESALSEGDPNVNVWLRIDLEEAYDITRIEVFNRTDSNSSRLDGAKIFVGYITDSVFEDQFGEDLTGTPHAQERSVSPGTVYARYVTIRLFGYRKILSLAEVKVFGQKPISLPAPTPAENLALGKPTSQSTTLTGFDYDVGSEKAVDGNSSGVGGINFTTATDFDENNPWWRVDLGVEQDITQIRIFNRVDCCGDELEGAKVFVGIIDSTDPTEFTQFGQDLNGYRAPQMLTVAEPIKARYVMVQIERDDAVLRLAEVEVYGIQEKNIALNKPATQIDTHFDEGGFSGADFSANVAVDGKTDGLFSEYNLDAITHTKFATDKPWWRVDLEFRYDIKRIEVFNRVGGDSNRLGGAEILIGDTPSDNFRDYTVIGTLTGSDTVQSFDFPSGVSGRSIMIRLPISGNQRVLSLAEVRAYGTLSTNYEVNDNLATGKPTVTNGEDINDPQQEKESRYTNDKDLSTSMVIRASDFSDSEMTPLTGGIYYYLDLIDEHSIDNIRLTMGSEMSEGTVVVSLANTKLKGLERVISTWVIEDSTENIHVFGTAEESLQGDLILITFIDPDPSDVLDITELEVFGVSLENNNIALGRPTDQTTTEDGGDSSKAVDGITNGVFADGSVTLTKKQGTPTFNVYLDAVYRITKIEIYNRVDCCRERIDGLIPQLHAPIKQLEFNIAALPPFTGVKDKYDLFIGLDSNNYYETSRISLTLPKNEHLSIAEIKVFGDYIRSTATNIALGKSTSQSSTTNSGLSSRAVDGNKNGIYSRGSVTHTDIENNPWWQVDLGRIYELDYLYIYNRHREENPELLLGAEIFTRISEFDEWAKVGAVEEIITLTTTKAWEKRIDLIENRNRRARYIMVKIPKDNAVLSLAELEAYGRPYESYSSSTSSSSSSFNDRFASSIIQDFVGGGTLSVSNNEEEEDVTQAQIFPNPNNGEFSVSYVAKQAGKVVFQLYSPTGLLIHTKESVIHQKGAKLSEPFKISDTNLSAGLYFLKIKFEDGSYYVSKVLKH